MIKLGKTKQIKPIPPKRVKRLADLAAVRLLNIRKKTG
jgi:hypothetical protein